MNKAPPTHGKTSRRQFVQLAGGLALTLRHGLLPAQTETDAPKPEARGVATLEDSVLRIEWDAKLYTRVSRTAGASRAAGVSGAAGASRTAGRQRIALTSWGPSEYLLGVDGRHGVDFAISHQTRSSIADANGPGTRLTLSGTSGDGVEKTVEAILYQRHPGIALVRVSYRNTASGILSFGSWTNGDLRLLASGRRTPEFWCYSGATYEDRRDWVQPVEPGFAQDNFLGMEASDYGGGTPIVDVWRRDGGLAVGHAENTPKRVSLPVQGERGTVRVAVCGREKRNLKPGEIFQDTTDLRGGPRRRLFFHIEHLPTPHVRARLDARRSRRRRPTNPSGAPGAMNAPALRH